jgi:hypothetical protein
MTHHIYPEGDRIQHAVDEDDCWCHPNKYCVCPTCDGVGTCWRCDDGFLPLAGLPDEEVALVVHNAYGSGN